MMKILKNRRESGRNDATTEKGTFAKRKGLLSTLGSAALVSAATALVAACEPQITIENIPYDPYAIDGGLGNGSNENCSALTENCQDSVTVKLREQGSNAGDSTVEVENADLTLVEIVDEGKTEAAVLELEACGDVTDGTFTSGETSTLEVADAPFKIKVDGIEYDGEGVVVTVSVMPSCPVTDDAGTDTSD